MKRLAITAAAFLAVSATTTALAADAAGSDALALAARVGILSPLLTHAQKMMLDQFLNGDANVRHGRLMRPFMVEADDVQCRSSDVDITAHDCSLTFGARRVTLGGREAQALYATLADSGVMPEGAAGSMFRAVARLSCSIDPRAIAEKAGAGTQCSFMSGA